MTTLDREYKAIIWTDDPTVPGKRVSIFAENICAASEALEKIYGEGNVYHLHNEDDAAKPRE